MSDLVDCCNEKLFDIVMFDQCRFYVMQDVIWELVDDGIFLEIQFDWVKNIIVGFVWFNGQSVGIVVNNFKVLLGLFNIDVSDKVVCFICICDCYNVLILMLVDVLGFLFGVQQEYGGIICYGVKMFYVYVEVMVFKVMLIMCKSYGGVYFVMNSCDMGVDVVYVWLMVMVVVMGVEGVVNIVYCKDIKDLENLVVICVEKIVEYKEVFDNFYVVVVKGYIDDVILMEEICECLICIFEMLVNKEEMWFFKKYGNILF